MVFFVFCAFSVGFSVSVLFSVVFGGLVLSVLFLCFGFAFSVVFGGLVLSVLFLCFFEFSVLFSMLFAHLSRSMEEQDVSVLLVLECRSTGVSMLLVWKCESTGVSVGFEFSVLFLCFLIFSVLFSMLFAHLSPDEPGCPFCQLLNVIEDVHQVCYTGCPNKMLTLLTASFYNIPSIITHTCYFNFV